MVLKRTSLIRGAGWLALLLLLGLLLAIPAQRLLAAPPLQSTESGEALFQQKCTACHTIGQGDRVGPDLQGVTSRRDRTWLTRFISTPDKVLAEGDPTAAQMLKKYNIPMPNLGLTQTQVASIVSYLDTQTTGLQPPSATSPVSPAPKGDSIKGKNLFSGETGFQNGGPPCIACHSIAGIGALGGGALGPDLTQTYAKFGDTGLTSILATTPLPTMNSIYGSRPLKPEEQANLKAFLQEASVAERPAEMVGLLALLGAGGLVLLLGLAQLLWRRRLTTVRQPLVKRPR